MLPMAFVRQKDAPPPRAAFSARARSSTAVEAECRMSVMVLLGWRAGMWSLSFGRMAECGGCCLPGLFQRWSSNRLDEPDGNGAEEGEDDSCREERNVAEGDDDGPGERRRQHLRQGSGHVDYAEILREGA